MNIKEHIIKECISLCKREDVNREFSNMMKPLINMLLQEIYPYILVSVILVAISFIMIMCILFILVYRFHKRI